MSAIATAPAKITTPRPQPVSRQVLQDRYDGLLGQPGADWSTDLWAQLHRCVVDLYEGTARREWDGSAVGDRNVDTAEGTVAGSGVVTDEALDMLRELIVRRVDELGLAR